MTQTHLDILSYKIIGAAIVVHKEHGPGLLESIYEKCLNHELAQQGFSIISQLKVPVEFKGIYLDCDFRLDLLVEDMIVVEHKAVESLLPIHDAQLLTYLKLFNKPKGILLNFNCTNIFKKGQKTMVTELYSQLPK